MIFGKGYDNALWLMLTADKKNRNGLVNFIKNIPSVLYSQIHVEIDRYMEYKEGKMLGEYKHLCGNYRDVNGLLYSFGIDLGSGELDIVASTDIGGYEDIVYSLSIMPYVGLKDMDNFDSRYIGEFSYQEISYCDEYFVDGLSDTVDYELIKTPLGYMVNYKSQVSLLKSKIKGVNLNGMPLNMHLSDLKTSESVDKLVRRKGKNHKNSK